MDTFLYHTQKYSWFSRLDFHHHRLKILFLLVHNFKQTMGYFSHIQFEFFHLRIYLVNLFLHICGLMDIQHLHCKYFFDIRCSTYYPYSMSYQDTILIQQGKTNSTYRSPLDHKRRILCHIQLCLQQLVKHGINKSKHLTLHLVLKTSLQVYILL